MNRSRYALLTLALTVLDPTVAMAAADMQFPGGARLVTGVNRVNEPFCFVLTPLAGAQAVVQGPRLWLRVDQQRGGIIARNPPPTVRLSDEDITVQPVEARLTMVPADSAEALIAALYADRPLEFTWTDTRQERHTVRIEPKDFRAAYDAAVKACGWTPRAAPGGRR